MSTAEERMQSAIEELEQENRLLRARNTRLEAEANAAPVQEPVAWEQELANILCRIHRDGGHYVAEHGWRKAIDDADLKVAQLNAAFDTTTPAAPVQEPVAHDEDWLEQMYWEFDSERKKSGEERLRFKGFMRAYGTRFANTTPPAAQRQWVGLTDEDKLTVRRIPWETLGDLMDNIEAKLKEKNS